MENPDNILEMRGIRKHFPGVVALDDVDFDLRRGEVHVIMGANGAGKSTLMKVLSGVYPMDSGTIRIDGQPVTIGSSRQAQELGVAIIHQHFSQVPHLSVAENLFLGREPMRMGLVDYRTLYANARKALDDVGLDVDVRQKVIDLGVSQRQMIEIAKALSFNSKILIMDEPTSALTKKETLTLFAIINQLKNRGIGIVYISHRIDELGDLGTRVTVMRDGRVIGTRPIAGTEMTDLVRMMVGKDVRLGSRKNQDPPVPEDKRKEVLRVERLSSAGKLRDISFSLYEGEILGLFGLMGAGRTELARALFGVDAFDSGSIFLNGQPVRISSPREAVGHRLGFLTEDRLRSGLCMTMGVGHNATLPCLNQFIPSLMINLPGERRAVDKMIRELDIKT
ncbi:MAG: sugar ABC transporter ATP-binding protein, partial [Planctomycetota bacterium]|nr:sugar ABC transporter ATP-binding protein [Planctomycetota bacterium]